jgi:hypothetical protein
MESIKSIKFKKMISLMRTVDLNQTQISNGEPLAGNENIEEILVAYHAHKPTITACNGPRLSHTRHHCSPSRRGLHRTSNLALDRYPPKTK